MLVFGTVSKVNYADATVDIAIKDQEDMIIPDVPYLELIYEMPEKQDYVCAIFEDKGSDKFSHGICLGTPRSKKRKPRKHGRGVYYQEFLDGTYIHYDPKTNKLETNAKKIKVNSLQAEDITVTGQIKAGSIIASEVTASGKLKANSAEITGDLSAKSVKEGDKKDDGKGNEKG